MTINRNPKCFFNVTVGGQPAGRIIVELYASICPKTAENFRLLCTGEMGVSKVSGRKLYYKGSCFHRIIKGFMVQGGDFEKGDGTGGESIYGMKFEDENFDLRHDRPGLLSMANKGPNTNGSQFFITTVPTPHLDGKHVVFGSVVQGFDIIKSIENIETDGKSYPKVPVQITSCGELVPVLKTSEKKRTESANSSSNEESSSESSDSEAEKKKKKKKKKRKHAKKRKLSPGKIEENNENAKGDEAPPECSVDPAEIPSIPPNKFLYRKSPSPEKDKQMQDPTDTSKLPEKPRSPVRRRDHMGRKIKGRGAVRYHSRSRSHSRGTTPPHWRREQARLTTLSQALNSINANKSLRNDKESDDEGPNSKESRFQSRSARFRSRLHENTSKGLNERFAPERRDDASPRFEKRNMSRPGREYESEKAGAKRRRHDSSRSPGDIAASNTSLAKSERGKCDDIAHNVVEKVRSPEERKRIAITPKAVKSPKKGNPNRVSEEYDPFSKNDKGSDSDIESKTHATQSDELKDHQPFEHQGQKNSSQRDVLDKDKKESNRDSVKDESPKRHHLRRNGSPHLKNVVSKSALKTKNVQEASDMNKRKESRHLPERDRRRSPRPYSNAVSSSKGEGSKTQNWMSGQRRSASKEKRSISRDISKDGRWKPRNIGNSFHRGRSPRSRLGKGDSSHEREYQRSRERNSQSRLVGGTDSTTRCPEKRNSSSIKRSRFDEKCGQLTWQPPLEVEYDSQGGKEKPSASQVMEPSDNQSSFDGQVVDNPQQAPDTDLSEKSMSMSSSTEIEHKQESVAKAITKKKPINLSKEEATFSSSDSSSSSSSSESPSPERPKSSKRKPRAEEKPKGSNLDGSDDEELCKKRSDKKGSHDKDAMDDDEEDGDLQQKVSKPLNDSGKISRVECDINAIPLPTRSSQHKHEADSLHDREPMTSEGKVESNGFKNLSCDERVKEDKEERNELANSELENNEKMSSRKNSKEKSHASLRRNSLIRDSRSPRRGRSPRGDVNLIRDRRSPRRNRSVRRSRSTGRGERLLRRASRSPRRIGGRNRSRQRSARRSRSPRRRRSRSRMINRSRSPQRDRHRRSRSSSGRRRRGRRSRSERRGRSGRSGSDRRMRGGRLRSRSRGSIRGRPTGTRRVTKSRSSSSSPRHSQGNRAKRSSSTASSSSHSSSSS